MAKVKIKIYTIISFFLLAIVLINCRGFNLLIKPEYRAIINIIYQFFTIFSLIFILMIYKKNRELFNYCRKYVLKVIFLFIIPQLIFTKIKYDQSIAEFYKAVYPYLYVVWIFPILYLIDKDKGAEKLLNKLSNILLFGYISIVINSFLKNNYDFSLFKVVEWRIRNNNVRIVNISAFASLVLCYNWNKFLNKENLLRSFIIVFLILVGSLYVEQTRAAIFYLSLTMLIMFLLKKRDKLKKVVINFMMISLIISGIMFGFFNNYFSQFSEENNKSSTTYRINEIAFYSDQFKKNVIFGIGLLQQDKIYETYNISSTGSMNHADIGYIGIIGVIGLTSVVIYVYPMIRYGKMCIKFSKDKKDNEKCVFLAGIYVYTLFSSGTLIILNAERIMLFPFLIAIFEYNRNLVIEK